MQWLGLLVTCEAMLFYSLSFEIREWILLIYLYILRTAKSNIIFYISKKIHMIFFISLNKNYVLKLEFRKYFIDVYTTRLKIFFCKESSCGEIWNYISHFYPSLKAPVCQWVSEWVSEWVSVFVCSLTPPKWRTRASWNFEGCFPLVWRRFKAKKHPDSSNR